MWSLKRDTYAGRPGRKAENKTVRTMASSSIKRPMTSSHGNPARRASSRRINGVVNAQSTSLPGNVREWRTVRDNKMERPRPEYLAHEDCLLSLNLTHANADKRVPTSYGHSIVAKLDHNNENEHQDWGIT